MQKRTQERTLSVITGWKKKKRKKVRKWVARPRTQGQIINDISAPGVVQERKGACKTRTTSGKHKRNWTHTCWCTKRASPWWAPRSGFRFVSSRNLGFFAACIGPLSTHLGPHRSHKRQQWARRRAKVHGTPPIELQNCVRLPGPAMPAFIEPFLFPRALKAVE